MKTDLHIHTSCSDGVLPVDGVIREAKARNINFLSLTDHDNTDCQEMATALAEKNGIAYIPGVELNVTFPYNNKTVSLDFLGYSYDIGNRVLNDKLVLIRQRREDRAHQILEKLNAEFDKEHIGRLTGEDIKKIEAGIDGAFGRPHIARYLVEKKIVGSVQEAFDKYLVKFDVPKYPLSLEEASELVRSAGGVLVLAHANDSHGTSLFSITTDLNEQTAIIEKYMLKYIDGVECWHSRHDIKTIAHYFEFAKKHGLLMTGGSDCHQKPISMGTVEIPDWVAGQFKK
jgi:3',5'-nucleoside bisphosphate phosphatase